MTTNVSIFVGNRVAKIRRHSYVFQLFHIDGKSNSADILSRGCSLKDLPDNWVSGSDFLHHHKCDWPATVSPPVDCTVTPDETEVLSTTSNVAILHGRPVIHPLDKLTAHYISFIGYKRPCIDCYV